MNLSANGFPPIESLVPHRGAMLWLERLAAAEADWVEATVTVPAGAWYLDEAGGMPAWLGVELMAQALSAHVGLRGWLAGKPPKPGVLLGCRTYKAGSGRFPCGETLRVRARLLYKDEGGFAAYDCTISSAAGELASATLKAFEPVDFAAFLSAATA